MEPPPPPLSLTDPSPRALDSPRGRLGDQTIPTRVRLAFQHNDVVEVLLYADELPTLQRNAIRDAEGQTLVHLACRCQSSDILWELISENRRNMPIHGLDFAGNHPLHTAAASGAIDQARQLMARGAKCNVLNGAGLAPADVAEASGYDYVAALLRDNEHGSAEVRALAVANWSEAVSLVDATAESQLNWKDVEAVAHLNVPVPQTPLPWTTLDVDALKNRAQFAVVTGNERLVAGMLTLNGEYQFDGLYFKVSLDVTSPHSTGTRITVYESLAPPRCFVECYRARLPAVVTVLRLVVPADAFAEVHEIAPAMRATTTEEREFLLRCGPTIRQAFLSQSLNALCKASNVLSRSQRWFSSLQRFRGVMMTVVGRVAAVKGFLKRTVTAKRLCVVALALRLRAFELYCRREFTAIDSNMYPAFTCCMHSNAAKRTAIVRDSIQRAKIASVKRMRAWALRGGERPPPFRYALRFEELIPSWIEQMDVTALGQQLLRKGSYLPRKTIMALQRRSTTMSLDSIARNRMRSEVEEVYPYFVRKELYSEILLAQLKDAEVARKFHLEENMAKMKEARRNAAMVASFIARLSGSPVRGGARGEGNGDDRTGASNRHAGSPRVTVEDAGPVTLMSIHDVVPPRAFAAGTPRGDSTAAARTPHPPPPPRVAQQPRRRCESSLSAARAVVERYGSARMR
jgi:hypothetical protein